MSIDYKPVACSFYDKLEAAATERRRVVLQYLDDIRQLRRESGVIDTLFVRQRAEFVRLKTGEEIRLDRIMRLDEEPAPGSAEAPSHSCGS